MNAAIRELEKARRIAEANRNMRKDLEPFPGYLKNLEVYIREIDDALAILINKENER